MGSTYIAAISSEPVVVIVDDQSILAVWLEEFFLESGLAVCRVEPLALAVTLADLDNKNHQIYKIVFLHGFTAQSLWLKDLAHQTEALLQQHISTLESLEILGRRSESLVAVLHKTSLDLSGFTTPVLSGLQQITNFEREIFNRLSQHKQSQIFVGVDTLDYSDGIEMPLLYSVLGAQQNVLFDPECDWYVQPINALYVTIANQLLKPHLAQTVVIHGKKKPASFWLDKIRQQYRQYFHETFSMVSVPAQSEPLALVAESIACQTQDSVQEVLDAKVRALPSFLKDVQLINQELIAAEQDPIDVSLRDLVARTQPQLLKNITNLPPKWHKTAHKESDSRTAHQFESDVKKQADSDIDDDKRLSDRSITVSMPDVDEKKTIIEEWNDTIKIQQLPEKITDDDQQVPPEKGVVYLDQELQKIFSSSRKSQKKQRSTQKVRATRKIIFKSKKHRALFYGGLTLVSFGCFVAMLIAGYQLTLHQARKSVFLSLAETANSQQMVDGTSQWTKLLGIQVAQYVKVVKEEMVEGGRVLVDIATHSREVVNIDKNLEKNAGQWLSGLQGLEEYDIGKTSQETVDQLGKGHEKLSALIELLEKVDTADLTKSQQDVLTGGVDKIEKNIDSSAEVARFLQAAPDIFGAREKKTYAVLVQNDLELRPTGGFLQNVLLMTWNRGVLVDTRVYSTYEIDNKLASAVKPPDEIKKVLGEQRWYLRDSNWNPDFPATAKQINWFVEESLGKSIDGAIAVNYNTIRNLLKVLGPIPLDEFNEEITDKNIYDKLEFHAEGKVENKSGKKVEYTTAVLSRILEEVKKLNSDKSQAFFKVFYDGLSHKEISFSSFNNDDAQILKELGWDGGLIVPKCPSQFLENTCVLDSLYQVDANVGVNKVNGYIEKKVEDKISVGLKSVKHQRVVTYTNNAKLDLWPQGTYRVYVKFYIPADAQLQSITANSVPISSESLTVYTENGSRIIGATIEVPKQKTIVVNLNYQLNHSYQKPFSYFYFNQRQSGDRSRKDVVVTLDKELKARLVAPKVAINGQEIKFLTPDNDDVAVGLTLE